MAGFPHGICDAHTNLVLPGERLPADSLCRWRTFDERLARLRDAGIGLALASLNRSVAGLSVAELWDLNQRIADACSKSDGLLLPSAIVQPALGGKARDLLRRCHDELGMCFVGEMFDRHLGYEWGTPEYHDLLAAAVELRMVPLIHCADAVAVEIARRHPGGRFLIAHLRGDSSWYTDRAAAVAEHSNLYVVTSGSDIAHAGVLELFVRELGAERVLFGTDFGGVDPLVAIQCIVQADLTDEQRRFVLSGSFLSLLALSALAAKP